MGSLKPGSNYIYERVDGVTYAREFGADPATRQAVGWDYDPRTQDGRPLHDHLKDDQLWGQIRQAAKTNPAIYQALERAKILYYLSKDEVT
jgi:hypothetical protein